MSIPKCQRTLNREVVIQGEGLHKGKDCSVIIRPSSPNSGIMFYTNGVKIPALYAYLTKDEDSTTSLSMGKTTIVSVEHILSCLYGMFIDNATVEVYGGELPFGDGSSSLFYEAIESVGVFDQEKKFDARGSN